MKGKTCVVTGVSGGLGFETALALLKAGARVVGIAISRDGGAEVSRLLRTASGNAAFDYIEADLTESRSVRAAAARVLHSYPVIDVLVNNAGGVFGERRLSSEGVEHTMALNHHAWFLLTQLLMPALKASVAARVVNVSSDAHKFGKIDFDNWNAEARFTTIDAYARSKMAMILCTRQLARQLRGSTVTVNAVHPGVVNTGFGQGVRKPLVLRIVDRLLGNRGVTPAEGAKTQIWAATAPELDHVSGQYFARCKLASPHRKALDDALGERVWQHTLRAVGLQG